jgi:nucleoid-associated protein YgaU
MLATIPVDADGNWTYTGELEPGDYEIVARNVSAQGEVLSESQAVAVPVESTTTVTVSEPQADASGEVVLSGSGVPGSTVEVVDNGVVVGTAVVAEDGTWTVRYATSAGDHSVAVQVQGEEGDAASVTVSVPEAAGGESYVVRPGDWLMKLARRYYGDALRWIDIYEATNAKAAQDASYHKIGNPSYLLPGWKIWIPEP